MPCKNRNYKLKMIKLVVRTLWSEKNQRVDTCWDLQGCPLAHANLISTELEIIPSKPTLEHFASPSSRPSRVRHWCKIYLASRVLSLRLLPWYNWVSQMLFMHLPIHALGPFIQWPLICIRYPWFLSIHQALFKYDQLLLLLIVATLGLHVN